MNWTLEKVAGQAVVLYEGERRDAVEREDLQAEQFWEGHRNTALYALRGTATPVTEEEVEEFIRRWNHEPQPADEAP